MSYLRHFFSRFVMAFFLLFMGLGLLFIHLIEYAVPIIDPLAQLLLGMDDKVSRQTHGSGDGTIHYMVLLFNIVMALVIALLSSAAARFKAPHPRWHNGLRIILRYYLALLMWNYGCAKVFKSQFPTPSLMTLSQPLGEASPMGLAWNYMGFSYLYNLFTGGLECLVTLLLLFPQTTLLGALLNLGVMGNVLMMNLSFDIPVKINSGMYVLMSLWLIWPDRWRLLQFFVQNRPVTEPEAIPAWPWSKHAIKGVILTSLLGLIAYLNWSHSRYFFPSEVDTDLAGVYTLIPDSVQTPSDIPIPVDKWKQWVIESPGIIRVRHHAHDTGKPQASMEYQRIDTHQIDVFITYDESLWFSPLAYQHADTQTTFTGRLCEIQPTDYRADKKQKKLLYDRKSLLKQCVKEEQAPPFHFAATRKQRDDYMLIQRGFHLINEYPFNR